MAIEKPDLYSVLCSKLTIYGHVTLDKNSPVVIGAFGGLKGRRVGGNTIIASRVYTIKRQKYTLVVTSSTSKKMKKGKIVLSFRILTERRSFRVLVKPRPRLNSLQLIEQLAKAGLKVELYVTAFFSYPTKQFESLISLPYDTGVPTLEKVKVVGLRINVKRSPDEDYSQVIDVDGKKIIYHSISFRKAAYLLNWSFLSNLLEEASKYSRRLIKERDKSVS